jgi:integrase/recombinase XerC
MINPDLRYLLTLQEPTAQRAARADMGMFVRWWEGQRDRVFEPTQLLTTDIVAWVRHRQDVEERKPSTINRGLSTLRRFGDWLVAEALLSENPAKGIRDLPLDEQGLRALPDDAVDALLRAVQVEAEQSIRLRDGALLALLAYAGLRSQEACDVQLRDLDLDGGSVVVRRGKGRKSRRVPLHSDALALLHRYLPDLRCPAGMPAIGSDAERECLLVAQDRTKAGHPLTALSLPHAMPISRHRKSSTTATRSNSTRRVLKITSGCSTVWPPVSVHSCFWSLSHH